MVCCKAGGTGRQLLLPHLTSSGWKRERERDKVCFGGWDGMPKMNVGIFEFSDFPVHKKFKLN